MVKSCCGGVDIKDCGRDEESLGLKLFSVGCLGAKISTLSVPRARRALGNWTATDCNIHQTWRIEIQNERQDRGFLK
jgi:hypothetical protein